MIKYGISEKDQQLEKNVIDDNQLNFLFKRGANLKDGLIDITRAYTVVSKLKKANRDGSKSQNKLDLNLVAQELLGIRYIEDKIEDGTSEEERWTVVINFM